MANSGKYYICFKEFLSISPFPAKFWFQRIFSFFAWATFFDLQLRIILLIDKLQDNCDKSEPLWKLLGPRINFSLEGDGPASELNYMKKEDQSTEAASMLGRSRRWTTWGRTLGGGGRWTSHRLLRSQGLSSLQGWCTLKYLC